MGVRKAGFDCIRESADRAFGRHLLKRTMETHNDGQRSSKNIRRKSSVTEDYLYLSIRLPTLQKPQLKQRPLGLFFT